MADEVTPPLSGIPAGPLTPDVIKNLMYQKAQAQYEAQKAQMGTYDQMAARYGQTGMSDIDKASILFQAAGALSAPTRSGGLMESIGAAGSAVAGPLQKAAQAQRDREDKLAQLQLARAKLSAEMTGGPSVSDLMSLYKLQQSDEKDTEKFTVQSYKDPRTGVETPYYAGSQGTIKPIDLKSIGVQPGQARADADLVGDDYINSLPAARANTVRALINGDQAVPNVGSPGYKRLQDAGIIDDISAALGHDTDEFNKVVKGTVAQTNKEWATGGRKEAMMTSLARSLSHLSALQEDFSQTPNISAGPFTPIANRAANAYEATTGNAVKNANMQLKVLADELAGYFKNAAGGRASPTQDQIKEMISTFPLDGSAEQKQAAIDRMKRIILDQGDSMVGELKTNGPAKYKGINSAEDYIQKVYPASKEAIERMESKPIPGSVRHQQLQSAPAAPRANAPTPDQIQKAQEELRRRQAQSQGQ
jgi:hypothetical protein